MTTWLNLASCFLVTLALRLHSGTITPLQLIFKIADSGQHHEKTGGILMDSLDVLKCFEDIVHLLNIRTLKFRHYFRQSCSKRFDFDMTQRYGKFAVQRNLVLTQMMGMNCVSKIENFGRIFPGRPLIGVPINSWTNVDSFCKNQVKVMLSRIADPMERDDLLFTGFLSFGRVDDEGVASVLLYKHTRTIFDGPFCEYNNRYSSSMTPLFLGIAIDEDLIITASTFDVNEVSEHDYLKIKAHLGDPLTAIDFIARLMQLTAAHIYTSFSTRIALNVPTPRLIKDVAFWLADFALLHSRYFDRWTVEVRAAIHLAKALLSMDIFVTDFKRVIAKAGYTEEHQFYDLIHDMTEQIMNVSQITAELVDMVARLKIETLIVISQFQVSAEIMNSHVQSVLTPRRYQGYPSRPRCRHLLVLLWALSKEIEVHGTTCRILMAYILENMSPSTEYFEVFRRLGLLAFLPFPYKQEVARQSVTSQLSSHLVEEVIGSTCDSESSHLVKLPLTSTGISNFKAPNGYLDVNLIRRVSIRQMFSLINDRMVYCGHRNGHPVYIQSLTCHLSLSAVFQLLLTFACVFRVKLSFTLHPHYMKVIAKPDNSYYTEDLLSTSVKYELGDLTKQSANQKIPQILMLIEQTKYLRCHHDVLDRTPTDYQNWVNKMYKYRLTDRSTAVEKIKKLHDELKICGNALVSSNVMKTSFSGLFELPGLSITEGFAILLNQPIDP